jgi:hypothetical protein
MPLIVEDGTGRADAESYVSEAEASAYFAARANEAWDNVEDKEAALRRATDYMLQAYHGRWKGMRATALQALDWPRRNVPLEDDPAWLTLLEHTVVPIQVKRATIELALIAADPTAPLVPTLERAQSSVSVGEISVTYEASSSQLQRFPLIDMILSPLLRSSGVTRQLVRT